MPTKTVNTNSSYNYGKFTSYIYDLKPNTTYYLRAYATVGDTTIYGKIDTIRTRTWVNCPSTVKDIDNNVYNVVTIGFQCWTKENLKVSRYRNGEIIPVITQSLAWKTLTTGSRCWYDNDSAKYEKPYGKLYNGYTVSDSRGLCPSGWHVPREDEWSVLLDFLGGGTIASGKMISTGTTYWNSPNTDATNESGFSALPGGQLWSDGSFSQIGITGNFFDAEESIYYDRIYALNNYDFRYVTRSTYTQKPLGASVRCLRD